MRRISSRDSLSAEKEADTVQEKTMWQPSLQNLEERDFTDRQQPINMQNGMLDNDSHRNERNLSMFVDRTFQEVYGSYMDMFNNVLNTAVCKSGDGEYKDQLNQRKLSKLDEYVLQRVKKLRRSIQLEVQLYESQQQILSCTNALSQHMNNRLAEKKRLLTQVYTRLQDNSLECLTYNKYMLKFRAVEAMVIPLLQKKFKGITSAIHDILTNNFNVVASFSRGYITSVGRQMQSSKRDELAGDAKIVSIPEPSANSKTAQQTRHLYGSILVKQKKMTDNVAPSRLRTPRAPEGMRSNTACEVSTSVLPSAQNEQIKRTMLRSETSTSTTEDTAVQLRLERGKRQGNEVKPDIVALPTEDEERAAESIRSEEESTADSHGATDTQQPLDASSGVANEGRTVAVPSDTEDEGNTNRKMEDNPDAGEDQDGFADRVHVPSDLFMKCFANSTPGSGEQDMPVVGDDSTPSSDDKGSAKTSGEQKPYISLRTKKLYALESISEAGTDQNQYRPSPAHLAAVSEDVFRGDETAVFNPKTRLSLDLGRILDTGTLLGMNPSQNVRPPSEVIVQPVVPQTTEVGLARVDFRSPDRERMNVEGFRVGTFLLYPRAEDHAVLRLANAGFYYTGRGDTLACFCCDATFTLADRRPGEDPYDIHRQLNPNCPHLAGGDTGNVFIQDEQNRVSSGGDITGSASRTMRAAQLVSEVRQRVGQAITLLLSSTLINNQQIQTGSTVRGPSNTRAPDQSTRYNNNIDETNMASSAAASIKGNDTIGNITHTYNRREINWEHRRPETANQEISPQVPLRTAADTERPSAANVPGDPSVSEGLPAPTAPPDTGYNPAQAVHSRYTDLRQREQSYSQWPDTHAQSPRELAVAGFFFTGIGDCVRCHYCGLGLKHWDPDDRPLDEHVRWRSSCGYLRPLLGEDFIYRTLARIGGGRSQSQTPSGSERPESGVAVATVRQSFDVGSVPRHPNRPQGTSRDRHVDALMTSEAAQAARDMGFPDDVIRTAISELLGMSADVRGVTAQNLIHAVIHVQQRGDNSDSRVPSGDEDSSESSDEGGDENSGQERGEGAQRDVAMVQGPLTTPRGESVLSPPPGQVEVRGASEGLPAGPESRVATASRSSDETAVPNRTPQSRGLQRHSLEADPISQRTLRELEQENQELRDRRRCKICLDNDVSILFLPCGHLVCCAECAPALRRCPMCRKRVSGTVRTHLAPLPDNNNIR